jgi:hypothetical protein
MEHWNEFQIALAICSNTVSIGMCQNDQQEGEDQPVPSTIYLAFCSLKNVIVTVQSPGGFLVPSPT